jgi:hypothetical protein
MWPAPLYNIFSILSHKRHHFWKTATEHKMRVLIFSTTFLILRRNEWDIIKMYIGLHIKYPYSSQILMKLEFSLQTSKKSSNIKFNENQSSGSGVPCGRTNVTKLIASFRNFANATKIIRNCFCVTFGTNGRLQKWNICSFGGLSFSTSQKSTNTRFAGF